MNSPASAGRRPWRVAIAGAGISGLAAARRLLAEEPGTFDLSLFDESTRTGGVIATAREQGCLLEQGPDCFLSTKPAGIKLCQSLGLAGELIGTTPGHRRSFIARDGRLHSVPEGFHLLAPSKFWPFVTTPLFSPLGKLRMGLDLLMPRRKSTQDESLAEFVTRRLGREALERAAQPMIGGIYTADPALLSLQATMPQFHEMEREHGSVLLGMWRARFAQKAAQSAVGRGSGARYDLFVTLKEGLGRLVETATAGLPPGAFKPGARIDRVVAIPGGRGFRVSLLGGADLDFDAVCIALPAPRAARLLASHDARLSEELEAIPYASAAIVNLVYDRAQIPHAMDGMGFVVPAVENRLLLACSFSSVKFDGRAPDSAALLRVFAGGAMKPEALELTDSELVERVREDLRVYLGVQSPPRFTQVSRHLQAMAQYHLGHLDRVARIEAREAATPGLALAGNAYRGVGIPDCIASGERAAVRLLDYLQGSSSPVSGAAWRPATAS